MHLKIDIPVENVYVAGDLHGNFDLLRRKISDGINDAVIIIAGDCSFGFAKLTHYENVYNSMKKVLEKNNVTIIGVRGNHDDPGFFDGTMINFKHLKAVPDYTVIEFTDAKALCVGGAISIDRTHREMMGWKKAYWSDEPPVYDEEKLDKILSENFIDFVISHSAPEGCYPVEKWGLEYWFEFDPSLEKAVDEERATYTKIKNKILEKQKIGAWFYGHFHMHNVDRTQETVYVLLDMFRPEAFAADIFPVKNVLPIYYPE